ncbi:T9SS type A sorting domain-containing protein [Aurantibacter aestuarii]|uniref:Secretion system C-terminal sorting domain-containing protein n=1 Tax=Aurantibacter aestuarii TaxID=1266046 RepID=A0A2T1ND36_9FLAO|nr:T9SS type A sorting domain-containing protein [Aurantibacter aestuarii]PSG90327.1 hypothetical protein C7H52_03335 [Aurantibacter aestuarii]
MKHFLLFLIIPFISLSQVQIGQDIDGEAANDSSGSSISLNAIGNIIAIGATNNDGNGNFSGHVRIYENQSGNWMQIGQDIDGEVADDRSGRSVSLSSDGGIVAIGANFNDANGSEAGHVRVYENIADNWIQLGQDIDGEALGDLSGQSISLNSTGNIIAIGAPHNDENGANSGHVRIFEYVSNNWLQIGSDIDGVGTNDQSGFSVSLNSTGNIIAIGAPYNDGNGNGSGHVRVYENIAGNWTQIGNDIEGEIAGDQIGYDIELNGLGDIIAIGTAPKFAIGIDSGISRIYKFQNNNWVKVGSDIIGETINDESGSAISLSSDGNIVAIGAYRNDGNGTDSGHVRVLQNINDNWIQIGNDIDGESADDISGSNVSLSSDGTTLAVGAQLNDGNGNNSGHVRVFDISGITLSTTKQSLPSISLVPNPTQDSFTISLSNAIQLQKVVIYNSLGQLVSTYNTSTISVANFNTGVYYISIHTNKGISKHKLIKR